MAFMSHNKHYKTGDARPAPAEKGVLRVYSMKFCPFAHRLKLALHAYGVEHETININTLQKPEWFKEINPRGTVPVIEIDGDVIYESDITTRYIDKVYGKGKLTTTDPWKLAKEEMLLGEFGKLIGGFFTHGKASDDEGREKGIEQMRAALGSLDHFLAASGESYICGDRAGMTDFMFWPIIERTGILHGDLLRSFAALGRYHELMLKHASVAACRHGDALATRFLLGYFKQDAEYDIFPEDM